MSKARLEAFSDGVLAIIITIMVLELKTPNQPTLEALRPLIPVLMSYILSFAYVGIYWNNHHHLLQVSRSVNGSILWANLHLLFWLSLIPFVTGWMGATHFASLPVAMYGLNLLLSGLAYSILVRTLIAHHGKKSALAEAIGRDRKGMASLILYTVAVPIAFWDSRIAGAIYALVAALWLIPDTRIERKVQSKVDSLEDEQ